MEVPAISDGSLGVLFALAAGVMLMPFLILGAAGAGTTSLDGAMLCAGGGTGQSIAGVSLDAEQMGNARTIVTVTANRHLPVYAAVVAVATSYTESSLRNRIAHTDHDSEGILQQRVSIYTSAVAADPVKATSAFLDRLVGVPNWQTNPVGSNAQDVQVSDHPERYQPNTALAEQLVSQFWPKAAAEAPGPGPAAGSSYSVAQATASPRPVCAGGGGGAGRISGPTGNNIAGTTSIPPGFVITGTPKAQIAVRFALQQLGKPYVFGAAGSEAWDCSGLTMGAWAAAGIALPHWTVTQATMGTPEPANLTQGTGGDLVFIPGSDGTPQAPGHVGIVAGQVDAKDGRQLYVLQAPQTGVPVELTEATQWAGQITTVRHIG
jgi:cell wall-associated NlpC family hydrolase